MKFEQTMNILLNSKSPSIFMDFENTSFSDEKINLLTKAIQKNKGLISIELAFVGLNIGDIGLTKITTALAKHTTLTSINLEVRSIGLTDKGLIEFSKIISNLKKLTHLCINFRNIFIGVPSTIPFNRISKCGINNFTENIKKIENLQYIKIFNIVRNPPPSDKLWEIATGKHIHTFKLDDNSHDNLQHSINLLKNNSNIQSLNIKTKVFLFGVLDDKSNSNLKINELGTILSQKTNLKNISFKLTNSFLKSKELELIIKMFINIINNNKNLTKLTILFNLTQLINHKHLIEDLIKTIIKNNNLKKFYFFTADKQTLIEMNLFIKLIEKANNLNKVIIYGFKEEETNKNYHSILSNIINKKKNLMLVRYYDLIFKAHTNVIIKKRLTTEVLVKFLSKIKKQHVDIHSDYVTQRMQSLFQLDFSKNPWHKIQNLLKDIIQENTYLPATMQARELLTNYQAKNKRFSFLIANKDKAFKLDCLNLKVSQ